LIAFLLRGKLYLYSQSGVVTSYSGGGAINPLLYLKAVMGTVGANAFPPIAEYVVSFVPVPTNVFTALSILLVALLTGGAVQERPTSSRRNVRHRN
jgi:hypothetical protein